MAAEAGEVVEVVAEAVLASAAEVAAAEVLVVVVVEAQLFRTLLP